MSPRLVLIILNFSMRVSASGTGLYGIDESTIAHWEQGQNAPVGPYRKLVADFVTAEGSPPDKVAGLASQNGFSAKKLVAVRIPCDSLAEIIRPS